MKRIINTYALFMCLLVVPAINSQKLITVSADGTSDFTTITAAIAHAQDGDIIEIYGTITGDGLANYGIIIDKNLIIRGHGIDNTIIQASDKRGDPTINQRIFTISPKSVVIMENLSIRNGYLHGDIGSDNGAGIQNFGHLVIRNCKIYGNYVKVDNEYHEGHIINHASAFLSIDQATQSHTTLLSSNPRKKTWGR